MTLKEYIDSMNKLAEENPEALVMQVIHSIDDEGNAYTPVVFGPSVGHFDGENFDSDDGTEDAEPNNAVCIN